MLTDTFSSQEPSITITRHSQGSKTLNNTTR
jgi:hypothetical protein